jgi:hypothetical protein
VIAACLGRGENRRADAVAGGAFPIDNHASKKPRHARRIVLDAPCIQVIPFLSLAIRDEPFAD